MLRADYPSTPVVSRDKDALLQIERAIFSAIDNAFSEQNSTGSGGGCGCCCFLSLAPLFALLGITKHSAVEITLAVKAARCSTPRNEAKCRKSYRIRKRNEDRFLAASPWAFFFWLHDKMCMNWQAQNWISPSPHHINQHCYIPPSRFMPWVVELSEWKKTHASSAYLSSLVIIWASYQGSVSTAAVRAARLWLTVNVLKGDLS